MKKIYLLFAICIFTFSCTKDEEPAEKAFVPDPTIISEYHLLYGNEEAQAKYIFDEYGRFSKYIDIDDVSVSFEYDTNNRIINIIKTDLQDNSTEAFALGYDSDNRILSFGDRTFTYYPDNHYYIEDSSYRSSEWSNTDPNILFTEESMLKYSADANGIITSFCRTQVDSKTFLDTNITEIEGEWCSDGSYTLYYDANVKSRDSGHGYDFRYNDDVNPLYFPDSNLSGLLVLFEYDELLENKNLYGLGYKGVENLFVIASQNNLIESGEFCSNSNGCGPESNNYTYEFNGLNLPSQSTSQYYYVGSPEGTPYVNAKYYYQGDVIPE